MRISKLNEFQMFEEPLSSAATKAGANSGQATVLVIDDDESIRQTFELALKGLFDVITCASGDEGIYALTPKISAVILDIKMSGKDGFETYAEMKRKCPDIPIIFYSAYQDIRDPYEILNTFRPFGYVFKGNNLSQLTDTLRNAVDYSRIRSENERLIQELRSLNASLETQ